MKKMPVFLLLLAIVFAVTGCGKQEISFNTVADIAQANGARIGVMTGTTGEELARQTFTQGEVKSFDDVMDAVAAITSGQLDAIVTAYPTALQISKKNRDLIMLDERLADEDTAIAIRKDNLALLQQVNAVIAELKNDGTLKDMGKRWFKPDLSPYVELDISVPSSGKPLKIGVTATREPLSFVDKDGRITGHDGELARIIASKLGRPVEFYNMKFMALIPALQSGKVDMILSGMTATAERKKYVNFTEPYFANAQVILVKKAQSSKSTSPKKVGNSKDITSLQDLHDKRIAVLTGSAGDLAARKHFPQAKIKDMVLSSDAALAIKKNKVDAFVYDKSVLLNLAEKNPELQILSEPVSKLEIAVAIKKDRTALLNDINTELAKLKQNGTLQKLRNKWIDSHYQTVPTMTVPAKSHHKQKLRIGTNAQIEPFSFQANGKLSGLDIELAYLLADALGREAEFLDMNFEALIPALQGGKIDIAISNFNVTEERKRLIDFSQAYVENDISALVRKPANVAAQTPQPLQAANEGSLKTAADIQNKRIGVLLGSVHDTYAMQHYPKATVLQYKSPSDLVLAVKSGKVDAAIYTRETLIEILQLDPELALLGSSLQEYPIGIGFNQSNDALREQFNAFLKTIKQDGTYDDMVKRWIKQGDTTMPAISNSKRNGVLVAGNVSDKGLPFTVVKNGRLIGFDIELAERFGAYLGKEIKYADMEFGSLILAATSNKIDMIVSTLMLTDERKTKIDFSDPYYELGANIFVLKKNLAAGAQDATDDSDSGTSATVPAQQSASAQAETHKPGFIERQVASFNSNIIQEDRYLLIWDGLKVTVIISVFATLFGTLLGGLICFMRMSNQAILNVPAKLFISVVRGTPVLVFLMLIFYVVFASVNINPVFVAVIAFGMNFAAYVSEIFRTGINSVEKGQIEAGIAMGFTKLHTFIYITLPQTIQRILPVFKGEFISLVKMTSIVGYIAVQDLTKASDIIRSRTFDAFFPLIMIAILYFLISWVLMQSIEYVERATDPKQRRNKRIKA